jgi:Fur family ferric uptake transcriptional regulator
MLSEETIIRKLSCAGYRITQPRRAVVRAMLENGNTSSPAEVRERALQHCPTVGLVTVYRTLDLLSEIGFARRIHTEDGCHGYATANDGHRHHLICRRCGAAVEFEGCDLSPLFTRLSQKTGYSIEDHLLELVGVCTECQ